MSVKGSCLNQGGKEDVWKVVDCLVKGPLLLSISIISEFELDATGSIALWILAFPMSVQLHL